MMIAQLMLVTALACCVHAIPQYPYPYPAPAPPPVDSYGLPVSSAVLNPSAAPAPGPVFQSDTLELLPPKQHVVGTRYPRVDAGRGYRFPISQLLNPTPPPNIH